MQSDDSITIILGDARPPTAPVASSRVGAARTTGVAKPADPVASRVTPVMGPPPARPPAARPPVATSSVSRTPSGSTRVPALPVVRRPVALEVLDDETEIDGMTLVEFELQCSATAEETGPPLGAVPSPLYVLPSNPIFGLVSSMVSQHRAIRDLYEKIQKIAQQLDGLRREKIQILGEHSAVAVLPASAPPGPGPGAPLTISVEYLVNEKSTTRFRKMLSTTQLEGAVRHLASQEYVEGLLAQLGALCSSGEPDEKSLPLQQSLESLMGLVVSDLLAFPVRTFYCRPRPASFSSAHLHSLECTATYERVQKIAASEKQLRAQGGSGRS